MEVFKEKLLSLHSLNELIVQVIESSSKTDTAVVLYLFQFVQSENERNIYTTAVYSAIGAGNVGIVNYILKEKIAFVEKSEISAKDFRNACLMNESDRKGLLLELLAMLGDYLKGPLLECLSLEVLKECAQRGKPETFRFLIDFVDISGTNYECLEWLTTYGNVEIFKVYVEKGGKLNARHNYAIKWAARTGNLPLVRYLSQFPEVDVAAEDNYALAWVKRNGYLHVVSYLDSLFKTKRLG
jgi:hypothetical protein